VHIKLTATFVVGGAIHRSNGKGQESDESELHDAREGWDGSVEEDDARFLWPRDLSYRKLATFFAEYASHMLLRRT
jgi:hypothetical protein